MEKAIEQHKVIETTRNYVKLGLHQIKIHTHC
jgi:hypothetical protein